MSCFAVRTTILTVSWLKSYREVFVFMHRVKTNRKPIPLELRISGCNVPTASRSDHPVIDRNVFFLDRPPTVDVIKVALDERADAGSETRSRGER